MVSCDMNDCSLSNYEKNAHQLSTDVISGGARSSTNEIYNEWISTYEADMVEVK